MSVPSGASLTMQLGPDDVGRRVMIRHLLETEGSRATDVIGLLMAWEDGVLLISRSDGATVEVAQSTLLASKLVPPPPPKSPAAADLTDLELDAVMLLGWRGREAQWRDGWLLRAGQGFTGRANSAIAIGEPGPTLDELERWYLARGLPPRMQVSLPVRAEVDVRLAERGWGAYDPTLVMTAALDEFAGGDLGGVRIDDMVDDAWLSCYHYRGGQLPPIGRTLLQAADRPGFASIRAPDGQVQAIARGAIDRGWVGLAAIEVSEGSRRQGLGSAVTAALCTWAASNGAHSAYLQVAETNTGAVAMYERLGFTVHHRYHYRILAENRGG